MNFKTILGSFFTNKNDLAKKIKNIVGFYPNDVFLFERALVHKSAVHDHTSSYKKSNERLEFLGDAVLGAVVADYLFKVYPNEDEGFLTKMRSKIVSRHSLNDLAKKIGLDHIVIARLDKKSKTDSIYGNAFEALIGAIYLDKGTKAAEKFILERVIHPYILLEKLEKEETNFKSRIIEWAQKEKRDLIFEILSEKGEGREKVFEACVKLDGKEVARGKEQSKKKAEQKAAEEFCKQFKILDE
ncbi:MAG: ribonuclease III [Flavobacteriales bacterium]|nr:ribonuclease III [Flavobacteriales bacterium]